MQRIHTCYHTILFQIFFQLQKAKILDGSLFKFCLSPFLCAGTALTFFHSVGNFPFSRHVLKINPKGLQREVSQIFIVRILIISWPCALFRSKFLIIFRMLSLAKWIVDSNLCVLRTEGRSLFVFIRKHCFAKKLLNISAFSLKFVMNLWSCNNDHLII